MLPLETENTYSHFLVFILKKFLDVHQKQIAMAGMARKESNRTDGRQEEDFFPRITYFLFLNLFKN